MKFKMMLKRSWKGLKRASPAILAVVSGVGVVATAVLSAKATPKAMTMRAVYENERKEENKDGKAALTSVINICKCYAPAAITGAVTISCIFGAHVINQKRQKALIGAYAALGAAFSNYKSQTAAMYGPEVEENIQKAANEFDKEAKEDETLYTFIDRYRDEPYEKTWSDVLAAEYNANYQLQRDGYLSLNDFYNWLDLPPIAGGDEVGWSFDSLFDDVEIAWIPFINTPSTLDDGMMIVYIDLMSDPKPNYLE